MAKWKPDAIPTQVQAVQAEPVEANKPEIVYAESPGDVNFITLQNNLQNCLSIIDNEVMKNYVPTLQNCSVVPVDDATISNLEQIQFFHITELVYQEDEFSVHKLATIFNALSNKPCTLVLMIQSDGQTNDFYLGVRSRDSHFSGGTMRQLLEQSLLGLFPGSKTDDYFNEDMKAYLDKLTIGAISSVTCIADFKQDKNSSENKNFIQGLEKFIYSMQGKAFTAIYIANNLAHHDLVDTRKEYERIYTLMSPFANMQYNYALNNSTSTSDSDTHGKTATDSTGVTNGMSTNQSASNAQTRGTNLLQTLTDTEGKNFTAGVGSTQTTGKTEGSSDAETINSTIGTHAGASAGVSAGASAGVSAGVSSSVSRGKTYGTSHTDSISDSISQNLTYGINSSKSVGVTSGKNEGSTQTQSIGFGTQYSENKGHSSSTNYAYTKALTDTFGSSQAVTLNVQNKSLISTLERLEKQLARIDECESIGMWDFAAYFLGESAAEAETAASMYRSLISGNQSGLEISAINTWTDEERVKEVSKYVLNFMHPVFRCEFTDSTVERHTLVDATALASTNELAIQLGLPRKSVKGLPVIEHALFAQEVLTNNPAEDKKHNINLGVISHFGKETETKVELDSDSLTMHTFITGSTGSGKSNTIYQMLDQLKNHGTKFLVVEPAKGEYKNVFGHCEDVSVYGTNPKLTELLRINPFSFPEEIHIYEHMDRLIEIFNVCWPMYAAMPAVLKDAVERAYIAAGWNLKTSENKYSRRLFPTFADVLHQIDAVMNESQYSADSKGDYKGALSTRLKSLTNGINGLIFCADELSDAELFDKNVIVDLSRLGSPETKSMIMGLLVMKLQEHRMSAPGEMNSSLKHITVLEEAHNLLKRTSTEQSSESSNLVGKSVEMLTNAIAEMRTYGEGFIIADQAPGLLDMAVIRNTNTKIVLRLPEYSDRELVGRAMSLNDEQLEELARLEQGVAAVYQNNWIEAVLCKVTPPSGEKPETYMEASAYKDYSGDVKNTLFDAIVHNKLHEEIESLDETAITANLSAGLKCSLLEYKTKPAHDFAALSKVAYEFFDGEKIFRNRPANIKKISDYLPTVLEPSVQSLRETELELLSSMLTQEHIRRYPEQREQMEPLCRRERKI